MFLALGAAAAALACRPAWAACDASGTPGAAGLVLRYDVVDADRPRDPPMLVLAGSGAVEVRATDGSALRRQIPADEARALLRHIVETEGLAGIDTTALETATAPRQSGDGAVSFGMRAIADAPTSFFTLTGPDCSHSVAFTGLAVAAATHPEVEALQRLRRIELTLLDLVERLRKG